MNTPVVSIIIPVYNVEKYFRRCLDSISSQTYKDWECILIDDGSPDNCGKICDEYADKDSRFKVIHQINSGVSNARNNGINAASGRWIMIVDSDDWIDSNTLETVIPLTESYNIVQWGYYRSSETEDLSKSVYTHDFSLLNLDDSEPYGSHTAMLFRKSFLDDNQLRYKTDMTMGEDWLFVFECYLKTNKVLNIKDKAFYHYVQHDDSTVYKPSFKNIQSQIFFIQRFENLIAETPFVDSLRSRINLHKTGAKMNLLKTFHFKLYKITFPEIENIVMQEKSRFTPAIHLLHYNLYILAYIYLFWRYRMSDIKQIFIRFRKKNNKQIK